MIRNVIKDDKAHIIMLRLPKRIVRELKILAFDQGKSTQRLINEIIEAYVKSNSQSTSS